MADTVEKKIYLALLLRAQAFPLTSGLQRADPGIPFSPATTTKFFTVEINFNRPIETDIALEMEPIRQGFMRTNIMWPKGFAVVDAYNLAGELRAHLKRGTKLYRDQIQVRIDEDPEIGPLIGGDTHFNIPVTTTWRSYPNH